MAEKRLTEFLGELSQRRYDYARYNCFHMLNDWVKCVTGRDPMAPYRESLKTNRDARSFLRTSGGTAALASNALAELGARFIETPDAGDVALVLAPIEHRGRVQWTETCAICVGPGKFALLTSDLGLVITPMRMTKAWSLDTVELRGRSGVYRPTPTEIKQWGRDVDTSPPNLTAI